MIAYETARQIFLAALMLSILCSLVLLVLYAKSPNILLQSCCAAVTLWCAASLYISFDQPLPPISISEGPLLARPSLHSSFYAVLLGYFGTVVHAHMAFLMLDSCAQACGWEMFRSRKDSFLTTRYLLTAYGAPLLPSLYLVVQEWAAEGRQTVFDAFHWGIYRPAWVARYLTCIFACLGSFFSVYLLYRTTRLRVSSLDFKMITQLSTRYMVRINTTTFLYLIISMSVIYPLEGADKETPVIENYIGPSGYNFVFALIGVFLFAIFGCGSPARKALREFKRWTRLRKGGGHGVSDDVSDFSGGKSGAFTVVSDDDDDEIMGFESALLFTAPLDEESDGRFTCRDVPTEKLERRRSDSQQAQPGCVQKQPPHSKLSRTIDML